SGKTITINAPNNSAKNIYVQSVKVNGADWAKTYISHTDLVAGATIDFTMGAAPSSWGIGQPPPSLTSGSTTAPPMPDVSGPGQGPASAMGVDVTPLFDNDANTQASFTTPTASVTYTLNTARKVLFYTITSGKNGTDGFPMAWQLSGSNDGMAWTP